MNTKSMFIPFKDSEFLKKEDKCFLFLSKKSEKLGILVASRFSAIRYSVKAF